MARLIGPDEGSRLVYIASGADRGRAAAQGLTALVYSDSGATTLADIQTTGGVTIAGSALTVDTYSRIPLFKFPDGVDTVYVTVAGGPATAVYARTDDRLDTIESTGLFISSAALVANRSGYTHVSHRGGGSSAGGNFYQGPYPEETLEAFEASYAAGLTWFNPHIAMLADGALVLMHDATPDRTTDASGAVDISQYSTAAFKKLTVTPQTVTTGKWPGYGVNWGEIHPPFFSDYLNRFGGKVAHLIACQRRGWQTLGDVATAVVAELQARGLEDTAILTSFSATELIPAAAAGLQTLYLPPDNGSAGADATSIATAMASGWASDKPKHVAINYMPTGQTQATQTTYIATLTAAGFTVWAYGMVRRYDVAWMKTAGVVGFIHDEPVYGSVAATRVNRGSTDMLSLGVWPHGLLPADSNRGRGVLTNSGVQLDYAGSASTQYVLYGAFSPWSNLTSYTLQADFVWDTLDSDATRHADLVLGCPDDRVTSYVAGSGQGIVDGYQIILRQSAASAVVSRGSQSAQTLTTLLTQSTGLPPAASAGTITTFKVVVTSTTLAISFIQSSVTYGPFTVTDSTFRGGYFHLGKAVGSGSPKLIGTWKNVSVV